MISILANKMCNEDEVTIVALRETVPFYSFDGRVKIIQNPYSVKPRAWWLYFPLLYFFLARSFLKTKPDFVLSFGETISSFVIAALLFRPTKVLVFHRANPAVSMRGLRSFVNPIMFRFASRLVFQTQAAKQALEQKYSFARTAILRNPIKSFRNHKAIEERDKAIVSVGFLGDKKNQAALLRAFGACSNREGWTLVFLGDGPERKSLEQIASRHGLTRQVRFHGYVKDVDHWLLNSQIFGFTSLTEGFPNALAEALAAGCACIAYNCPVGPSDLITDYFNGLLIDCGDEDAFAKSLDRLISERSLRQSLAGAAIGSIEAYDPDSVVRDLRQLLAEVRAEQRRC